MFRELSDGDYQQLLAFRDGVRRFLRWSEQHAYESGITPGQHQLLLAIRGHPNGDPSINDLADHLLFEQCLDLTSMNEARLTLQRPPFLLQSIVSRY